MDGVEITAGRLHLRPWQPQDATAVYAACQDPEIQRWIAAIPAPYTEADAREFVGRLAPQAWAAGTEAAFAVLDATDGRVLGSMAVHHLDAKDAIGQVGFWCTAAERGRGVTTSALRVVCRWAFGALALGRIEWYAEVGNTGSRRVAEKAGFTIEATLRGRLRRRDGSRADAWVGGLLTADLER